MKSVLVIMLLSLSVPATWKPEYALIDPEMQKWYREQISPKTNSSCCSEADGVTAQEDIRGEHYWVRFVARGIDSDWIQVPDDVIIRKENRHGAPIVWWFFDAGNPKQENLRIRCFIPGAGL